MPHGRSVEPSIRRWLVVAVAWLTWVGTAGVTSAQVSAVTYSQRGPEDAAVTILEFSDFECPYCARMPDVLNTLLANNRDRVRFVFKHSPLPIHPKAPLAHEAALAAGAQGKFWEMHDLLFANQGRLDRADLEGYARQMHLDVAAFTRALDTHEYRPLVARDLAEAAAFGLEGTPTFLINGRRLVGAQSLASLQAAVDAALNPRGPSADPNATSSNGDVRPERLNVEGAPVRGASTAPVTIVSFSDLQCPFCARAHSTLTQLMAGYEGKVRFVFKHFPLAMHVNAPLVHRAALAAGAQGKFWEMHDALFADQRRVSRAAIVELARTLGLDVPQFERDLDDEGLASPIGRDEREGVSLGIDGTPTFFINGVRVVGAQPEETFRRVIDRALVEAGAFDVSASRSFGLLDAPVQITWFGDLRSPLNMDAVVLVKQLVAAYPKGVRVTYRNAPLAGRQESIVAYDAALAAGAQGKFWEMLDLLSSNVTANDSQAIGALAGRLGLNTEQFATDLGSRTYRDTVTLDSQEAKQFNVSGTPSFVIDGERIDGLLSLDEFKDIVDRYLERPPRPRD